jgi:hypothetical protein
MIRMQFELPEDRFNELKALMQRTGVNTQKDFINNALTLLEWVIKEKEAGRKIASVDEDHKSYRELVMPILSGLSSTTAATR